MNKGTLVLPALRPAVIQEFTFGEDRFLLIVGFSEDGTPGEIRLVLPEQWSLAAAARYEAWARDLSQALQSGSSVGDIVKQQRGRQHAGILPRPTSDRKKPTAESVEDYVLWWLVNRMPWPGMMRPVLGQIQP